MRTQPFTAEIRRLPDAVVLDLHGEVNAFAEEALNAAYAAAEQENPPRVVLNFSDVGYINSTGIALIVSILAQARKNRRPLSACGLSEHYQEIFQITRLVDFLTIYPDEASALKTEPVK